MTKRETPRSPTTVPPEILPKYQAITALTDAFCKRHLNEEYAQMCRRLTAELARKRPTPLKRGRAEVWGCGIVRTIGWANLLDDPKSSPYMKLIDIDPEFGVANSTGQGKSMAIKRMFGIGRLNVEWTLPSRLDDNPVVWKVKVNGVLVDIRQESRKKQEAAFKKGLIPWIPADREQVPKDADEPQEQPDLASFETDLFGAVFGFYQRVVTLLRQSSLDDAKVRVLGERIELVMQNITDEMERSRDWNLAGRLESAYDELRCFAEELSAGESDR